jgi:hypothetical protein
MVYRRRPQGAIKHGVALYARIDPEVQAIADRVSIRLGVSKAEFIEELLRNLGEHQLDADDVPTWWTDAPPARQEPSEQMKLQAL